MTLSNDSPGLLTTNEVATLCRAPVTTVYTWIAERKIGSVKVGRRVLVPREEIERMLAEGFRPRVAAR